MPLKTVNAQHPRLMSSYYLLSNKYLLVPKQTDILRDVPIVLAFLKHTFI